MRALIVLSLILTAACAKKNVEDMPVATSAEFKAPAECTSTGTGAHQFLAWGTESATTYSCNEIPQMDCTLAVGDSGHIELFCQNQAGQTPTMPAACGIYTAGLSHGLHEWLDQTLSLAHAYDCGVWQSAVRCFFFAEDSGAHYEMRCLDNELP